MSGARLRTARSLVAGLALAGVACQEHDLFGHPWNEGGALELTRFEARGVSRQGTWLQRDGRHELPLGRVEAGSISTALAPSTKTVGDARARVWMRDGGAPEDRPADCDLRWTENDPVAWQTCRIAVSGSREDARLEIRWSAPGNAALFVSSPLTRMRGRSRKPAIFLIVIDALRADRALVSGDTVVVGESLARLAEDAIVFERARSTSSWTRTAAASLLTGLSPQRHRVFDRLDMASAELLTLAEILQGHGYQTVAWSGNPNVLATWGFAQGFDEFVDLAVTPYKSQKTDAGPMFDAILKKIEEVGAAPIFYYLHLMDPHNPYLPPHELMREVRADEALAATHPAGHRAGQDDLPRYQRYLAEIVDVDAQLGRFLDVLAERGLYDESIVLVTSDHGEEFEDHGGRFHGKTLFEEVLRVVGILKLPSGEMAGSRIAQPVDLADLMPAVLHGAGIPVPEGLDGRNPLEGPPQLRPLVATLELDGHSYTSVLDGEWKLILERGGNRPQLFDLRRNPQETENLFETRPDVAEKLGSILVERRASYETGWHVRGCGIQTPHILEFHLSPSRSQPRRVRFESNDELVPLPSDSGTQRFRARLDLQPRRVLNTRDIPPVLTLVEDEDEIILPAPGTAVIEAIRLAEPGAGDLLVSLGSRGEWIRTTSLTLDGSTLGARVEWKRPITCHEASSIPGEHAGRPYLRIWHEESVAATAEPEEIGPELRSRLRALGYAW